MSKKRFAQQLHFGKQLNKTFMCSKCHTCHTKSRLNSAPRSLDVLFTLRKATQRNLHALKAPRQDFAAEYQMITALLFTLRKPRAENAHVLKVPCLPHKIIMGRYSDDHMMFYLHCGNHAQRTHMCSKYHACHTK